MKNSEELKGLVKEKYAQIAGQSAEKNRSSCCGAGDCATDYTIFSESYDSLKGYVPDADLGLGCGIPTEFAIIKEGDTVIDLGSGAGNDCFVARAVVGEKGEVIGIDMTEVMVKKAKENANKLGLKNVNFRLGEIEDLPVSSNRADVVISNCVLNLVPDKTKAFNEVFRVLKPMGHFSISDVVIKGVLPEQLKEAGEMYAGCVSGAIDLDLYLNIIKASGFTNIKLQKEKVVFIPDEILSKYISEEEIKSFRDGGTGIYSVTVYGEKPEALCCAPGECCN